VSDASSSAPTVCSAETVVVHLLQPDQRHLARLGATSGIDRFADASNWERLPTGETYAPVAAVWIRGRTRDRIRAGSACIMVVDAIEIGGAPDGDEPLTGLVYHNRVWHGIGPQSALTS
jgi:flavin reductase (DIM6/NTAB) family NADH-FMN oxidoreductase RutF